MVSPRDQPRDETRDPEATIIYVLLAMLGLGRLVAVWRLHEPFGWEATVALTFAIIGLAGLAARARSMVVTWKPRRAHAPGATPRR